MKKLISAVIIILFTFAGQGCDDNFLNIQPKTEIGEESFFNSASDLQMYLNSLLNWPTFGWSSGIFIEASDDAATTGVVEWREIMVKDLTSRQITQGWEWDRLRDINYFLEHADKVDIPEKELKHYKGIARFHRARFYMNKVQRYGPVPYYEEVLSTDDEDLYKPRDSRELVVNEIFDDYTFAAKHVKANQAVGAVDNAVVKTFMARHALFEGTFRKYHDYLNLPHQRFLEIARDQAKDIIDSGKFSIYTTGNPRSDYGDLFTNTDLAGNPEVILINKSIEGEKNSGWTPTGFGGYEQSPTKDLLQAYLMDDGSYYSSQSNWKTNSFVEEFQNRDPRLYQTYAHPDWVIQNVNNYAPGTQGETYVQELNKNFTGYHLIKWYVNTTDEITQANLDIPVLRYAEVLLTYAEARAELGELTQNDLDITVNKLRDRVDMPHMQMNPPVDPVQQDRYQSSNIQVTNPNILEIRRERRVELAFEDRRYEDILRYRAGHLLENLPRGIYFSGLGDHDLTGDGVNDIKLIDHTKSIPAPEDREKNANGKTLRYYQAGPYSSDATVLLENGDSGRILARDDRGSFNDPKYYYRPIPHRQMQLNDNFQQIFGWE